METIRQMAARMLVPLAESLNSPFSREIRRADGTTEGEDERDASVIARMRRLLNLADR